MQLVLCLPDDNGNVTKEQFMPVDIKMGSYSVIYRYDESDPFSLLLHDLKEDEELGFKGGKTKFDYKGKENPILGLTIVTAGLGISLTMQLLEFVLADPNTLIDDIEVLWMNERKVDFILNDEVEKWEYDYIDNLYVTRVVDKDILNEKSKINSKVMGAITPYGKGRVAIFFGTDRVQEKSIDLLESLGYSGNNIVIIPTVK